MDNNAQMNATQDDEISVWDIVDFLKDGWRWLAGGVFIGIVCALAYLLVTPKQFEAKALFQGSKVLGSELESAAQLIERLKFPTFYETDQIKACGLETAEAAVLLAQRINPAVLKGTNILQVAYKARSSESAVQCLNAIMDRIISSQNALSETTLQNARKQLALTQGQLAESERIQSMLEKRSVNALDAADTKFGQTVLLLSTSLSKKEEIQRLRKSVLEQMAALEPPATQSAQLIEPIYASEHPVAPKKLLVLAGGLFGGLVLGGLAFFVRRSWLSRRA